MDLTLVVPCYQEERHLRASVCEVIATLDQTVLDYEIIFVDDHSTDNTLQVIKDICSDTPRCRYVAHETNRGRGAAFKTGFSVAKGTVVGFIDIDLEVHVRYVPDLVRRVLNGSDVVTGRRYYVLSQTQAWHRHILSTGYRALTRAMLDINIADSETGCKFFRRSSAAEAVLGCHSDGWFWDTEVMVRSYYKQHQIVEIPCLFLRRFDKPSTVSPLADTVGYFRKLWRFRKTVNNELAH